MQCDVLLEDINLIAHREESKRRRWLEEPVKDFSINGIEKKYISSQVSLMTMAPFGNDEELLEVF